MMMKTLFKGKTRMIVALLLVFAVDFEISKKLIGFLTEYLTSININVVTISPYEYVLEAIKLGFMIFLATCLPIIIYLVYNYSKDALLEKEKKLLKGIPKVVGLATLGLAVGLFFSSKIFLPYLETYQANAGIQNMRTLTSLVRFLIRISTGFAILFQLPLLLNVLVKAKILNIEQLQAQRKVVIIILLISSALLSPPDPVSMIIMMIPSYGLYELTLFYLTRSGK